MELPFKYIVLYIIRQLNERSMPLSIDKVALIEYITELMNKSYFTIEEKKEIGNNFNFEYELSDLATKYYYYFDIDDEKITFDSDYVDELNNLISDEMSDYDIELLHSIDFTIQSNATFLEIIGVKIRKELYECLLDIEKELEECYDELYGLDCYVGMTEVDTRSLINKIKKLNIKKKILLINTKNLLPNIEYKDLNKYAGDMIDRTTDLNDVSLLMENEEFNESDVMYDVLLRSMFTYNDLYISNLRENLIINLYGILDNRRFSIIKFYLTFIQLLDKEIEESNEILNIELVRIKYRIMNVMDSVYDTTLFMNNNIDVNDKVFKEKYDFIEDAVYYFVNELLLYDDCMYKNNDYDTDNVIVYLNNIIKKLLIETYYKLTNDKKIINEIKNNKLYGTNIISSNLIKDIVDKPKTKIK